MAHNDQFTATGPAFTEAGFPRAAFSTGREGTDSTYGVNVQGSECGVYGECRPRLPQGETTRTTQKGTGVCGIGDNVGVSGDGVLAGVSGSVRGEEKPGVVGSNFGDGPGVAGFSHSSQLSGSLGTGIGVVGASNKGAGVVGLSKRRIVLRDVNFGGGVVIPDQNTDVGGEGTGVIGASGSGTGVEGVSDSGVGVIGRSRDGVGGFFNSLEKDALVGDSGGPGNGVRGTAPGTGSGVRGESTKGFGVFGDSAEQSGVVGRSRGTTAPGVFGFCARLTGVAGRSTDAPGVFGDSVKQAGVMGRSGDKSAPGVFGFGDAPFGLGPPAGVLGLNDNSVGVIGSSAKVIGVLGNTDKGLGVVGVANFGAGVPTDQITDQGIGVIGLGNSGFGAAGMSTSGTGIFGSSKTGLAGHFKGPVMIEGDVTIVGGTEGVAVPHPDGSHRQLYCIESPESWFEDFGEARLVNGKAEVRFDRGFAALVKLNGYHVFLTPYGDCKGMFVTKRAATGFRVCEQQGGTSNVRFAYRVVAKRKDVVARRLAKVTLPKVSKRSRRPDLRLKIKLPDFKRLSVTPFDLPSTLSKRKKPLGPTKRGNVKAPQYSAKKQS